MSRITDLRKRIVEMAYRSQEGHIPSALSILDIVFIMYDRLLQPNDKFVLSKGHGALALYVVLEQRGVISPADIDNFASYDSILGGHPDMNHIKGVEASTGSLGHGLPIAVGMAWGKKLKNEPGKVYCLIGDGECNEGSVWEALMIADEHSLNNLVCIVDYNHSTDRAMNVYPLANKIFNFGWDIMEINGHDWEEIYAITAKSGYHPLAIIANTVKGRGIRRMENNPEWHHKFPSEGEYNEIMEELG